MPQKPTLPDPPIINNGDPQAEVKNIRYQAELDMFKAEYQAKLDRETRRIQARIDTEKSLAADDMQRHAALSSNDFVMDQAIHSAYIEVTKGEIDRFLSRAELVLKAATAIGTAYTGILALSFGVSVQDRPLPVSGITAGVFLGLAIILATASVSYFKVTPDEIKGPNPEPTFQGMQRVRLNGFIIWTKTVARRNLYLLRAAVISLGSGVVFMPAPYLAIKPVHIIIAGTVCLFATFLVPVFIQWCEKRV